MLKMLVGGSTKLDVKNVGSTKSDVKNVVGTKLNVKNVTRVLNQMLKVRWGL